MFKVVCLLYHFSKNIFLYGVFIAYMSEHREHNQPPASSLGLGHKTQIQKGGGSDKKFLGKAQYLFIFQQQVN